MKQSLLQKRRGLRSCLYAPPSTSPHLPENFRAPAGSFTCLHAQSDFHAPPRNPMHSQIPRTHAPPTHCMHLHDHPAHGRCTSSQLGAISSHAPRSAAGLDVPPGPWGNVTIPDWLWMAREIHCDFVLRAPAPPSPSIPGSIAGPSCRNVELQGSSHIHHAPSDLLASR